MVITDSVDWWGKRVGNVGWVLDKCRWGVGEVSKVRENGSRLRAQATSLQGSGIFWDYLSAQREGL